MKPITVGSFCDLQSVSAPAFSPKGSRFCFVLSHADKKDNTYRSCIYELQGKKVRQLTAGGREGSFVFEDENTLLFAGDREGNKDKGPSLATRYYRLSLDGGEAVPAFTFPLPVETLLPLPGGDYIVAASTVPGWEDLYKDNEKRTAAYLKSVKENEDYEVVEQVPWWWNGSTFTRGAYTGLYYYNARKNRAEMLSAPGFAVSDVQLSPDKKTVWFLGNAVRPLLSTDKGIGLYKMALADRKIEKVFENDDTLCVQGFVPGDSFLLVLAHRRQHGINTDCDFYKLDYADGSITLYKEFGQGIGSSVGTDVRHGGGRSICMDGDVCYFIATIFDGAYLYRLQDGEITRLTAA